MNNSEILIKSKLSELRIISELSPIQCPGMCNTTTFQALQNILSKLVYCRNHISYENFKLKLCMCAQMTILGTRTKFQLEILTINVISGIVYVRKNIWRARKMLVK